MEAMVCVCGAGVHKGRVSQVEAGQGLGRQERRENGS